MQSHCDYINDNIVNNLKFYKYFSNLTDIFVLICKQLDWKNNDHKTNKKNKNNIKEVKI